jgi:hypothetical protein
MAKKDEMQHVARFSKGRAAAYQAIADRGGDSTFSADAAQAEANKFQAWADRITQGITERNS